MKKPTTMNEAYSNLYDAWNELKEQVFAPIRKVLMRIIIKVGK